MSSFSDSMLTRAEMKQVTGAIGRDCRNSNCTLVVQINGWWEHFYGTCAQDIQGAGMMNVRSCYCNAGMGNQKLKSGALSGCYV